MTNFGVPAESEDSASQLVAADLVPDTADIDLEGDEFEHGDVANRLAELVTTVEQKTNVALFGAWGSGKSSIYSLLKKQMTSPTASERQVRLIRYDAWRFGGTSLKRSFVTSAAKELEVDEAWVEQKLYEDAASARFPGWGALLRFWWVAVGCVLVAAVSCILYASLGSGTFTSDLGSAARYAIARVGLVFGVVLAAIPFIQLVKVTSTRSAPKDDEQFVDLLHEVLRKAKQNALKKYQEAASVDSKVAARLFQFRVVIFVDELDRCAPSDVLNTLVGVRTFLESEDCVFVVAADRDVLVDALEFSGGDTDSGQSTPLREFEPYYSTAGSFLDKMFQHQIELPPLRRHALGKYAKALVADRGEGLWSELDSEELEQVIYVLIPAHVRSPRRVKVLMNNFAVTARLAQSRNIPWRQNAAEIAKLTVLRTEFPNFARDLVLEPTLISLIEKGSDPPPASSDRLKALFKKHVTLAADDLIPDSGESPSEQKDDDSRFKTANQTLVRGLRSYLSKTAYAGVVGPRLSLLYMEPAGARDDLSDPTLGDVIDSAGDHTPEENVAPFKESSDAAIAVRILRDQFDEFSGAAAGAIVETVCRLVELLNEDDLALVATQIADATLHQVATRTCPPGAVVGALRLAALPRWRGSTDAVVGRLRAHIVDADALSETLRLDEISFRAGSFDSTTRTSIFRAIAAGIEHPDGSPVVVAIDHVPAQYLNELWQQLAPLIANRLKVGAADPEGEPGESAAIVLRLLDAMSGRRDVSPKAYAELLKMALDLAALPYSTVLERASQIGDVQDSSVSVGALALAGIRTGPNEDWSSWSKLIRGRVPAKDLQVTLTHAIETVGMVEDELEGLQAICQRVGQTSKNLSKLDGSVVTASIAARLSIVTWDEVFAGRLLHQSFDECAAFLGILESSEYSTLRVEEVARAATDSVSVDVAKDVVTYVEGLGPRVRGSLAERLIEDHSASPSADLLPILVAAQRGGVGPAPLPASALVDVLPASGSWATVSAWIETFPPLSDLLAVLTHFGRGGSDPLVVWARAASSSDRGKLWRHLLDSHATSNALRAVAADGVSVDIAEDLIEDAAATSLNQSGRDWAVKALLTLPLGQDEWRQPITKLVENLLENGYKRDVPNAAELLLAVERVQHGHLTNVRKIMTKKGKKLPSSLKRRLSSAGFIQ